MRHLLSFASFALIASTAAAQSQGQYSHEPNTYRTGTSYQTVSIGSVTSCAALCGQDQTCKAWSFQRRTALGPASCELKANIGRAEANPLMVSGINPRIASQGQANPTRRIPSADTLLGGPTARAVTAAPSGTIQAPSAPFSVTRNNTTNSRPVAPTRPPAPIAPTAPTRQAPPPPPIRLIAPPPPPAAPAPIVRRNPVTSAGSAIAPTRTLPPPPGVPAPVVSRAPIAIAPPPAAAPIRQAITPAPKPPRLEQLAPPSSNNSISILQAGEFSTPTTRTPPRINVPVEQGNIPDGAILRDAPPPQISFTPLTTAPLDQTQETLTRQIQSAPPVSAAGQTVQAPAPTVTQELATFPRRTPTATRPAPKPINTAPAGSVPPPPVTPATPYNQLRDNAFPAYSVNNSTALTPEELAAEQAAQEAREKAKVIETLNLDGNDLASDVGAPVSQDRTQRRRPTGGGS